MHKRFRQFIGTLLVIANLLSTNMALAVTASALKTEPTETAATVETEDKEETTAETESESSESLSSDEPKEFKPTPAPTAAVTPDEETTETAEVVETTEETTAETTEAITPSATPLPTESETQTATPTGTPTVTATPSPAETEQTSETTAETTAPSATPVPEVTKAVSETLTRKILDSSGNKYTITASYGRDTGIPFDAELVVKEITSGKDYKDYFDKTLEVIGDQSVNYVRFFDISIVKDGVECEPAEGSTVNVKIQLDDDLGENISVVHFADDAEPEIVKDLDVKNDSGTEISFEAEGFSAYAIVDKNLEPVDFDWSCAKTLDVIQERGEEGFYITSEGKDSLANYYLTGGVVHNVTNNSDRDGLEATKTKYSSVPDGIEKFYFASVNGSNSQYKIYLKEEVSPGQFVNHYVKLTDVSGQASRKGLTLVTDIDQASVFTLTKYNNYNSFTVKTGNYSWNRNNKANQPGNGDIVGYTTGDTNEFPVKLMYRSESVNTDPYDLNNKLYGLMFYDTGISGKGMTAESSAPGTLDVLTMPVLTKTGNNKDKLFVPNDSDLTLWRINWVTEDKYNFTTQIDGVTKYLDIGDNGIEISDTPKSIQVVPGIGNNKGKISLVSGNNILTYSGAIDGGFSANGSEANRFRWLNLVELSELTSEYVLTYAATKISVADERITDGTKLIIYTRVWNESAKRYDFYAVDHDGSLVPVYEDGDEIQWIGDRINTLLWDYTIYYTKGKAHTKENENGYYELYNEYSEKFISPNAETDEALADSKIGINMTGRSEGEYYSGIVAWDDPNYRYAGIRTDNGRIISYDLYDDLPVNESKDFYFATITDLEITDSLTEVETVDNDDFGIKMKMINFDVSGDNWKNGQQCIFLGDTGASGNGLSKPTSGLLSQNLDSDGYPTNRNGQSLKTLYTGAKDANHLFVDSIHKSSGYFEYDCTQNFAHFDETTGDFTVYQELGTRDYDGRKTLQHGIFLPYNEITPGYYSSYQNIYDISQNELPASDPRKYEELYKVDNPDYNFAMELETSFVQTPDGKDNWDHDIIYEFEGDDDFWLYVDGKLVLDLGGTHYALKGTINFCTGEVYMQGANPENTTLYDIFRKNYKDQGHTDAEADEYLNKIFKVNSNGQHVFKDYTTHTMKIFYMERGQGSSNLHMRFNQSSVKANTVILSKELENIDETETFIATFPFQIWYQLVDGDPYAPLTNYNENIQVHYKGTKKNVRFENNYSVGGCNYENVYFLESGESCEIKVPDGAIKYFIVECGVDPDIYNVVKANGTVLTGADPANMDASHENRKDFAIQPSTVDDRTSVDYVNSVDPAAIRTVSFKKILWDENGIDGGQQLHNDDARFDFRLYFGSEHDTNADLKLANMHIYHVKDEDGNYCKWDSAAGNFVKIADNATDYSALTLAQKKLTCFTTSMYGAISKIPAFYTVEIRQVLAGSKFEVEERYDEIPDGFSRIKYVVYDDQNSTGIDNPTEAVGLVDYNKDPVVEVHNLKGYAIRLYKKWVDEKFMAERDSTYYAVYIGDELKTDSIYELPYEEETLYWYFKKLEEGKTLADYHLYEVDVKDPVVDTQTGRVTSWSEITPVKDGETLTVNGRLKGETANYPIQYTASYSSENVSNNIRVDTITNDRAGLTIYKKDMQATPCPLAGARFELRDDNNNLIDTFTSGDDGKVAKAYLRKNVDYKLIETKSPFRYHGLDNPLTVKLDNNGHVIATAASEFDDYRISVDNSKQDNPVLTVHNIRYNFTITKKDKNSEQPIEGVKFELHKMRTVGGVSVVDFHPMAGYENLLTDREGIVPNIDSSLPAGTYELREVETPITHHSLNYYVMFTVSETGDIKINSVHPEIKLLTTQVTEHGEQRLIYTLLIYNLPITDEFTIVKEVRGNLGNKNEKFPVEVTFSDALNQPYIGSFSTIINGNPGQTYDLKAADHGVIEFTIKHGDRVEFTGLAENTKFKVVEDYKDYRPAAYVDNVPFGNTGTVTGNIEDNHLIKFVNTREGIVPTGVDLPFEMSAVILSAMTAVVIFNTCWKMRRREDEED